MRRKKKHGWKLCDYHFSENGKKNTHSIISIMCQNQQNGVDTGHETHFGDELITFDLKRG